MTASGRNFLNILFIVDGLQMSAFTKL
jgi:hypothetical protein